MTEQTKIPVPPKKGAENGSGKSGKSLLERASGAFDSGGFQPAPMPKALPDSPIHVRHPAKPVAPEAPREPAEQAATAASPRVPVASAVEPVHFSGVRHPVDRAHLREQGLIVPEGEVTTLLEEFRIVKRQILRAVQLARAEGMAKDTPAMAQRVLICSPLPGEGKTFCATNLALAIAAEKDSEVLLVDADFAQPSLLSVLGLPSGGPGLMDALADPSIKVEDCVLGTDIHGFWVLPAGNQTTQDSELLASARTGHVLDRLTQGAPNRVVIFDSPPALAASPAAELAKYVGQAVLVVRADTTGQSAIEDSLSLLSTCPDIKLLLNDASFSPSGRRFGSYYGYGE